ncbi:MAG: type II secretion system F family protein [Thermodesulfovibrionales bacterium]|nr:type II secretion system F family protein [Thermodesulfovibrionales bacterium]
MAYFNYRAIDEDSRIIKGKIEASDEDDLEQILHSKGLILLESAKGTFIFHRKPKLSEKELVDFTYLLNLILTSGVPLMNGLSDMATQSANRRIATATSFLKSKLETGKSISDSMLEYPELFPPFYTSMVRAGEVSGNLEQVLNDIMAYLEWQIKLKKDVKSALAYPAIVLTAVASLIAILFIFVMPKFMKILTDLKVSLPLPTKILVFVVGVFKSYWPLIILGIILIPILYRIAYHTTTGRRMIDRSILELPLIGDLVRKLNHSRYFRTFATLFRSGLNMNEILRVSSDVVKNTVIADSFNRVTNAVLGGEQFSRALKNSGDFAPLLVNMVEIGEKTGTLDNTIVRISNIYDREIPETMKKIFTIIEPIMLVLLGGLVLLTVASFFLPLYKIVGGIRR